MRLALVPEGECDSRHDGDIGAHVTDRLKHALAQVPRVQVPAARRRIRGGEVGLEEVGHGHAHHEAGTGVADHRADHVPVRVEGAHGPDRDGLLTGPQPGLGDHPLPDPPLQGDVVEPGQEQVAVDLDELRRLDSLNPGRPVGLTRDPLDVLGNELGFGSPLQVFGWIEGFVSLHGRVCERFTAGTARTRVESDRRWSDGAPEAIAACFAPSASRVAAWGSSGRDFRVRAAMTSPHPVSSRHDRRFRA